jgi:predicted nucleic acid-binding protein
VTRSALEAVLPAGAPVLLDTSVILAYLTGGEPASASATILLDQLVRSGRNPAIISALTLAECLVRPFRVGAAAAAAVHGAIASLPNLAIADVTASAAHEAARIRARTGLRLPDATILATAATSGIGHVVANDARWRSAIEAVRLPVSLCHLDAIAATR